MCRRCGALVGAGERDCMMCGASVREPSAERSEARSSAADHDTLRFVRAIITRPATFTFVFLIACVFLYLLMEFSGGARGETLTGRPSRCAVRWAKWASRAGTSDPRSRSGGRMNRLDSRRW